MSTSATDRVDSAWDAVVGQPDAVERLRAAVASPVHAYLFVGPRGAGKRVAARAFAAELLGRGKSAEATDRARRLALNEQHPDLVVIEPEGNIFRGGRAPPGEPKREAQRLLDEVVTSPREGDRKVVIGDRFHTANDQAIGSLLKVIEDPPPSAVIILLSEEVPPEHATVVSRCTRIDFGPVPLPVIVGHLVESGIEEDLAEEIASASGGNIDRGRLLSTDSRVATRREAWRDVPNRLDGTGAVVASLVSELQGHLDEAQGSLEQRQSEELRALDEWIEQFGTRASGRRQLVERQRREIRLLRTDELRFGLVNLAERYRDHLASEALAGPALDSLRAIQETAEALERNPNETLLLQALLVRLAPLPRSPD